MFFFLFLRAIEKDKNLELQDTDTEGKFRIV